MCEIPVLPKLESMIVNTGNLLLWDRMKHQHHGPASLQEIEDEMSSAVSKWLQRFDESRRASLQFVTEVQIPDDLEAEDAREHQIPLCGSESAAQCGQCADCGALFVLKLVVSESHSSESVKLAVCKLLSLLNRAYVDLVLISVRHKSRTELTPEQLYEAWRGVEALIAENRVLSGGICDLVTPEHISAFCNAVNVKPRVAQVSHEFLIDSALPKALADCADALQLRLTTHNDSCDPLPNDAFRNIMKRLCTAADGELWQVQWLARYSFVNPTCGTINGLGYVCMAERDTKQLVQLL